MPVSRLTATIIRNDEHVFPAAFGPIDGKFGLYIGTLNPSPSAWMRPRDLVTSEPTYPTADAAQQAAADLIAAYRAGGDL